MKNIFLLGLSLLLFSVIMDDISKTLKLCTLEKESYFWRDQYYQMERDFKRFVDKESRQLSDIDL